MQIFALPGDIQKGWLDPAHYEFLKGNPGRDNPYCQEKDILLVGKSFTRFVISFLRLSRNSG